MADLLKVDAKAPRDPAAAGRLLPAPPPLPGLTLCPCRRSWSRHRLVLDDPRRRRGPSTPYRREPNLVSDDVAVHHDRADIELHRPRPPTRRAPATTRRRHRRPRRLHATARTASTPPPSGDDARRPPRSRRRPPRPSGRRESLPVPPSPSAPPAPLHRRRGPSAAGRCTAAVAAACRLDPIERAGPQRGPASPTRPTRPSASAPPPLTQREAP